MLAEYSDAFPSVIVRFAALFSDWCEYPPLYMFLRTWLSKAWNSRILGGRGESAIPYLHINDATSFLKRVLRQYPALDNGEILIASPDGAVSHEQLYIESTQYYFEDARAAHPHAQDHDQTGHPRADVRQPVQLRKAFRATLDGQIRGQGTDRRRLPHPGTAGLGRPSGGWRSSTACPS